MIVIGAGIVGVSTAYELAYRGVNVTLIEEREGAGLGTSYANGGQLSACEVSPWPGPEVPRLIVKWLGRHDAPLRLRPKLDPDQWIWLTRFLLRCTSSARRERIGPNLGLALLTRERLAAYRSEFAKAGQSFDFDHSSSGILRIFRDRRILSSATEEAGYMESFGLSQSALSPMQCVEVEPALSAALQRGEIAGGLYAPSDASGDAHLFSVRLAEGAERLGVKFVKGVTVQALETDGKRVRGVRTDQGVIEGDTLVVAAGTGSIALLKPLGIRSWIYPLKGYSVTLPAPEGASVVSVTDEARKIVVTRLGNRLRAAGQVEVGGYDLTLEEARARVVLNATTDLFPQVMPEIDKAEFWCGLRPMTPDGSPVIGRLDPYSNLYINSGHGTLGWTMGAGGSAALADTILGAAPQPDLTPFSIKRF